VLDRMVYTGDRTHSWRNDLDDNRPAAERQPVNTHTTVNTTEPKRGGATPFILGGLVVAVLGIGYFLFSTGSFDQAGTSESGGGVSINVETGGDGAGAIEAPDAAPEPAAEPAAEAEPAAAEPAPTAPAPAD